MPEAPAVGALAASPPLDVAALERYGEQAVPALRGPLSVHQIVGGSSNPTFIVQTAAGQRCVLRKKPPGALLPSAHQVEREYRVMKALEGSGVPVPRMLALCEDAGVIGTAFYLMEYLDGRVSRDARLPGCTPAERWAIFDAFNEALARLHQVDPVAVGLGDFGKPGNYFERQFSRWERQYRAAQTETIPEMDELIAMLPALLPHDEATAIVHGDSPVAPHVTLSVGVASAVHAGETRAAALLDAADSAMYAAKRAGRRRAVMAG